MSGRLVALLMALVLLAGCGSKLVGYNLKTTVGQTDYDDGRKSLYTGASADFRFDVVK
jgi:hypothetical protein